MFLERLAQRLSIAFRGGRFHDELREEMREHLAMKEQELREGGMAPEEAHSAAAREFGNATQWREESHEMWGWQTIENFLQDVKFGLRMLAKNPGFTVVAVFTLALGIGANTAMFTVVNGVLLKPLPYPEPERIVHLSLIYKGQFEEMSFDSRQFEFWMNHRDPFESLAATTGVGFNLAGASRPERVKAQRVSTEFFKVLGIQPFLGRGFLPDEDRVGGSNVAVLSYGLWVRDLGSDPKVIGRSLTLDGTPFTVVGVMPSGFQSMQTADLWTTIGQVAHTIGSGGNYHVIGKLKPGISRQQANRYLAPLTAPFAHEFLRRLSDAEAKQASFAVFPYNYVLTNEQRGPLLVLFGAIGFVLLIACVNVANLQMARAATRHREIAVRTAMGAGSVRLFRQLLTESVLLGVLGAAFGLLVAYGGLHSLLQLIPVDLPHAQNISLDRWALGFTALVAVLAGILFGIAPALRASRPDLHDSLKESGNRGSTGRHRLGPALVVAEVALSLVLLVGSGLLIKTFSNLLSVNPGFNPHRVLSIPIWTTGSQFKLSSELATFYEGAIQRIKSIPGIESAAVVAAGLPLEDGGNEYYRVGGGKDSEGFSADYREVTPQFFHTLGVQLLQGRLITAADSASAAKVVVVNAAMAREHFHESSAIGAYLTTEGDTYEIVGVVADVKSHLNEPSPPTVFVPMAQASVEVDQLFQGWFPTSILVRTSQNPLSLSHAVLGALREADPNLPIGEVRSMDEVLSLSLAFQRFLMTLMTVFAGLALALAAVGLYGVISYSVSQRTHEVGIRMALGAARGEVLSMIVGQGLRLALLGTVIGLVASFFLARLVEGMLFGVTPKDPATLVEVSGLLILVASLACFIPARRATQVDPLVALRYE